MNDFQRLMSGQPESGVMRCHGVMPGHGGDTTPKRFAIIVESTADRPERMPELRIRLLLKRLGRDHALRCVDVRQLPAERKADDGR